MTKDEVLKLALEHGSFPQGSGVIHAIKEALAQPEQEPVAITYREVFEAMQSLYKGTSKQQAIAVELEKRKLYTTLPQRSESSGKPAAWVGLTDEEIETIWRKVEAGDFHDCVLPFAKKLEAKLKEKNT